MKKIVILGLHLNFGGVEQAIINQANMLCDNYNVELIIFYKLNDKPAFNVNPKVKIRYLTDLKPNREEFKMALKRLKLFKTFKEGLKSIKILWLKKKLIYNAIEKSDADVIISSRIEFTELLNKSKNRAVKIAEEHTHHHNNKGYVKRLNKACKNIDYLIPVSNDLKELYSKTINGPKCILINNSLDYWPNKITKYPAKKLVSIGRLSPEKGYLDLIDVFNILNKKDSGYVLNIIGDGVEMPLIKKKIEDYQLTEKVILHGFRDKNYINDMLMNSSIYLMSSYEESFGIVLIEAGSFGLPSIAFDSAQGANEIIINKKSGYLISNRNKNDMVKAIIKLSSNEHVMKKMGEEARNIAKTYSFDNIKDKWLKFLGEII